MRDTLISEKLPKIQIQTKRGSITIEMFEDEAPNTVANMISLIEKGYYDGLDFHRVIPDFMIQGGCPYSRDPQNGRAGTGGPGWKIPCERAALSKKHDKPGLFSMANAGPNTGGSQFFLTTVPTPWLNGNHAVFGEVIEGIDVVYKIENCDTKPGDRPYDPQKIIKIERI